MKRWAVLTLLTSTLAFGAMGTFYYVTTIPKCRHGLSTDGKHSFANKVRNGPPVLIDGVSPADCKEQEWLETCTRCFSTFITMIERVGPKCPKIPPPGCRAP